MSRLNFTQTRSNKSLELICRNPIFKALGKKPMAPAKQVGLALAAIQAFDNTQRGVADVADRDTLACTTNVVMVLCETHGSDVDLAAAEAARDALERADTRKRQGKAWNLDGVGITAFKHVLRRHDELIAELGQTAIVAAILEIRHRNADGHVVGVTV
jgi:hypothetical protein